MSVWMLWVLGGCRPDEETVVEVVEVPDVAGDPVVPRVPLFPWPSDQWLVDDAATRTGRRLELPQDLLPDGVPAEVFADHDGFTRVPALLTWIPGGVDPATLPDLAGSVEPDSSVRVVRVPDLEPVPLLVELDQTAIDPQVQALIARPQITLSPDTAYVVLVTDGVATVDGAAPPVSEAFRALRDDLPTDNDVVEAKRPAFAAVRDAIAGLGLEPTTVVQGWTFHTRSEEQVVAPVLSMHDAAMDHPLEWTLTSDTRDEANRLVEGVMTAPDYLDAAGALVLDDQGMPVKQGTREVEVLLTIPDTIDEPRPVILFGHGFFSAKEETTWGSLQQSLQPWRFSTASVDFIGFNEDDFALAAPALSGDVEALDRLIGQQLQSQSHFTLLARLVSEELAPTLEHDAGAGPFLPFDPDAVHYMGISNGGTQGAVIVAGSPVLDRGALVVPGGGWSHMMQRAVQWGELGGLLQTKYPDALEMQLVLSLIQQVFDPADSLNYMVGLDDTPFEGRGPKQVTLHMAVEDAQVSNMVTEWMARAIDMPLIVPSPRDVWGLPQESAAPPGRADLSSGLVIYDEGYEPYPEGNVAPSYDNGAHETIRDLMGYRDNVGTFLEHGAVLQACDGACDPE